MCQCGKDQPGIHMEKPNVGQQEQKPEEEKPATTQGEVMRRQQLLGTEKERKPVEG